MLQSKSLKRVWVPIDEWEEIAFNMWGDVDDHRSHLRRAVLFTGNYRLYGRYMQRVVSEWPRSCANALTDDNINRRAWVGHAACALAIRCPEYITRQAWGMLTDVQRILANREADRAILAWEVCSGARDRVRDEVAQPMLFRWNSR